MNHSSEGKLDARYILPFVALFDVVLAVAVVLLLDLPVWALAVAIPLAWTDTLVIGLILRRANSASHPPPARTEEPPVPARDVYSGTADVIARHRVIVSAGGVSKA